jgi:hypothetical protein
LNLFDKIRGVWNLPYVSGAILMKRSILDKISNKKNDLNENSDYAIDFAENLRDQVFLNN